MLRLVRRVWYIRDLRICCQYSIVPCPVGSFVTLEPGKIFLGTGIHWGSKVVRVLTTPRVTADQRINAD